MQSSRRLSKLITNAGGKRSYTSSESCHCKVCSRTFASNSSSVISAFSKTMTPVTIHTRAHACLRVVYRCPYILGFSLAGTIRLYRSSGQPWMFSSKLDLILHSQIFPPWTICNNMVLYFVWVDKGTKCTVIRRVFANLLLFFSMDNSLLECVNNKLVNQPYIIALSYVHLSSFFKAKGF